METSHRNYCSMCSRHSWSVPRVQEDILNLSPRLSYHNPAINLDRRLRLAKSFSSQEDTPRYMPAAVSSQEKSSTQSVLELVNEISTLEVEVANMERYLLSLYRTAFEQHLPSTPSSARLVSRTPSEFKARSVGQEAELQKLHKVYNNTEPNELEDKAFYTQRVTRSERASFNSRHTRKPPAHYSELCAGTNIVKTGYVNGRNRLIQHLGASVMDQVPQIYCKLSEDIIKCISSIYCKLASLPNTNVEPSTSPTTSASSSSTFSALDASDNWSPKCSSEVSASNRKFQLGRDDSSPYGSMIEIPQIRINGERFEYASKMLTVFRSLIRQLEKVDPRKMNQDEQLAFWINIHNALVMHALLAYGLRENHIKSKYAIQKAAYNVGGNSVDAYLIQSSILRCQPHHTSLWLGKLFLPAMKLITANVKHQFSLEKVEPLVHFALCSGASSDPALRAYAAKTIREDLELAKAEFIRANVTVQKDAKIVLPKVLQVYAKDASIELPELVKMVCKYMPENERKVIEKCFKRRAEKSVEWSQYKSSFRYIVHPNLAKV